MSGKRDRREIRIGSITWQSAIPSPLAFAASAAMKPNWVPRIYMVMKATSNFAPESRIADFKKFQAEKQFRALTYCRCTVETDGAGGALTGFEINEAAHDPGWTPPLRFAECLPSLAPALMANPELRRPCWRLGEASALAKVQAKHHPNSSIQDIPDSERVLVNALIKCRAGPLVDEAGLRLGSPFHVPWVWNEWLLTHTPGQLKLYMRASKFPSHAWYVDGEQVMTVAGLGDATFPEEPPAPAVIQRGMFYSAPPPRRGSWIHLGRLALYPRVLSIGAPASDLQTPNGTAEQEMSGPVFNHPNTVSGWRINVVPV
jgi:hypothetical protein